MYITSGQKTAAMIGGLLIVGAGAFAYLDPMELNLLGLNPAAVAKPAVAKKAPPRPAKTVKNTQVAKKSPVVKPKGEAATARSVMKDMLKAPSAMQPAASSEKAAMPTVLQLPTPEEIAAGMQSKASKSKSTSAMNKPTSIKPNNTANTPYPPSMDVRYCLDEQTPQEIAKCAGEL